LPEFIEPRIYLLISGRMTGAPAAQPVAEEFHRFSFAAILSANRSVSSSQDISLNAAKAFIISPPFNFPPLFRAAFLLP
jgi:hypothetical protein